MDFNNKRRKQWKDGERQILRKICELGMENRVVRISRHNELQQLYGERGILSEIKMKRIM